MKIVKDITINKTARDERKEQNIAKQGYDEDLEILANDADEEIRSMAQKQRAIDKMNAEMRQKHSSAEDKLHNWICSHLDGDDAFSAGILAEGHTISGAMQYCSDKARKSVEKGARYACIEDDVVYSWAKEYFLSKDTSDKPKTVQKLQEKQAGSNVLSLPKADKGSGSSQVESSINNSDAHKTEKHNKKNRECKKKTPRYEEISLFDF